MSPGVGPSRCVCRVLSADFPGTSRKTSSRLKVPISLRSSAESSGGTRKTRCEAISSIRQRNLADFREKPRKTRWRLRQEVARHDGP